MTASAHGRTAATPLVVPRGRPDPRRLEVERYPFTVELQTRWGDMDPMRHLNNAALARYYEEGRIRFMTTVTAGAPEPFRGLVDAVHLDYLREAHHPAPLVAAVGVADVGRSSVRLLQALFQDGACVGVGDVTLVHVVPESRVVAPVPEHWRELLDGVRVREE